jgi:hypothetical protein
MNLFVVAVLAGFLTGAPAASAPGSCPCSSHLVITQTPPGERAPGKKKDTQPSERTARPEADPLARARKGDLTHL